MATFQSIVMIIATIILVITLCFIGISLRKQKKDADYPPVIANCPDYWMDMSGNNGSRCTPDPKNPIGNPNCNTAMDFSQPQWRGQSGSCGKYKWANQCNLTWDGITNNASVCSS